MHNLLFNLLQKRAARAFVFLALGGFYAVGTWAAQSDRVALVVGNAAYINSPLANPKKDALAMSALLKSAGFEVSQQVDTNLAQLQQAVTAFGQRIKDPKIKFAVFYYAGHGVQLDWRNYLVPITAKIRSADDVRSQTVDVSSLIAVMNEAKNRNFLIILDACRDDPFAGSYRAPAQGLSQFDAPSGSVLAYSTSPGKVAFDGEGENGLYTSHLLKEFAVKGVKIEDAFKRTRLNVRMASNGEQVPWETTSLEEDVYLFPDERQKLSEAEQHALFEQELTEWAKVKNSTSLLAISAFIRLYPSGSVSELAASKLNRLQAAEQARKRHEQDAADALALAKAQSLAKEQALAQEKAQQLAQAQEKAQAELKKSQALLAAEKLQQEREVALRLAQEQALVAKQESERRQQEAVRLEALRQEAAKAAAETARNQAAEREAELARQRQAREAEALRTAQIEAQARAKQRQEAEALAALAAQAARLALEQAQKAEIQLLAQAKAAHAPDVPNAVAAVAAATAPTAPNAAEITQTTATTTVPAAPAQAAAAIASGTTLAMSGLTPNAQAVAAASLPAHLVVTPYYRGSTEHLRTYLLGDVYEFQVIDRFTKATKPLVMQVTQVDMSTDTVQFNQGEYVSDMMGNILTNLYGSSSTPRQFYPAEIVLGKRWKTQFVQNRPNGVKYTFRYSLKVVAKERITVPAGTFDTYKIEARGFNMERGATLERNIWIAPGINADIAHETIVRLRGGQIEQYDRQELVRFSQKSLLPPAVLTANR